MHLRTSTAAIFTAIMLAVWCGYLLLIPFAHGFLEHQPIHGMSLSYVLGALIIVLGVVMTGIYVYWADRVYDPARAKLRETEGRQ